MRTGVKCGLGCIGLVLALGFTEVSFAASSEETVLVEQGAYRLGEIVVSASRESVVESSGTVYRVTADDIEQQGARNLNDALELIPGLVVREGAEGSPRIDIRGFRTRHVQLFLNGIPIRNSYDGQFDPTRIPAGIISEIKVTSGGASVLYGPSGNGGAIDIITKTGAEGVHGSVGGEIGTGGHYLTDASLYGTADEVEFYGNVNLQNREYFPVSNDFEPTADEDGDHRENSDKRRGSVLGNLSYKITDKTTLGLTVSHMSGENGKPPASDYGDAFSKNVKYERLDDIQSTLLQLAIAHETKGPFDLRAWAYYSRTDLEEKGYDDDSYSTQENRNSFTEESETEIAGISGQLLYHIGEAATATLGLTAENEAWEAEGFKIARRGVDDLATDHDLQTYSAALEYQRELGERFGFVIGTGYHRQERDETSEDDFSYLLGLTYQLSDVTNLRVNHSRKIRFPSVKQLYSTNGGNEDLETEVTYHYEAGVDQQLPWNSALAVTGFIIDAEDFIEKIDTGAGEENTNFQEIRFVGVETELTIKPTRELMLRGGITWLDTEDQSANSLRDELQYRPEYKLHAEVRYSFNFGLDVYGSILHVEDQYFYDDTQTQKKKLNDITVTSIKFSQQLTGTGFELYAGVDNLFDEDYEESYGLPQPGRTVYAGLEYRF